MFSKVIVEDCDVDAALLPTDGKPALVLRPTMTFQNAVRAVRRAMPSLHPDQARALVRKHLPDATDLEAALGQVAPPIPIPPPPAAALVRKHPRAVWVAGVLAAMLCGFGTFGVIAVSDGHGESAAKPAVSIPAQPTVPLADAATRQVVARDTKVFKALDGRCMQINTSEGTALCDMPLLGRGVIEYWPTVEGARYRLSFGTQVAAIMSFTSSDTARIFYTESVLMYRHADLFGPWMIASTSQHLTEQLVRLLRSASNHLNAPTGQ